MADITSFIPGTVYPSAALRTEVIVAQNTIDFSKTNVASGAVVNVLRIPKGAFVIKAGIYVKTAEGSTLTATYGDASGANSWDASVNLNSTGIYVSEEGTDAYAIGKIYTVADTLDLTMSAAADTAVVYAFAEYSIIEALADA